MLANGARKRIRTKLACLAVAASMGVAGAGVSTAAAQGLFESLFGNRFYEPAPPVYQAPYYPNSGYEPAPQLRLRPHQPPRRAMRAPDTAARQRSSRANPQPIVAGEPSKPAPYVAPQVMPGPLGRFLRDPTLQAGDVVATADGLMVFRGSRGSRPSERDFVPLARAGGLIARNVRTELAKLDRALDSEVEAPASKPASAPIVAQDQSSKRRRR